MDVLHVLEIFFILVTELLFCLRDYERSQGLVPIISRRKLLRQSRNLCVALPFGAALLTEELSASAASMPVFNYAAALQIFIYFYDAQKSGPGVSSGLLDWREDCDLSDTAIALKNKGSGNVGVNMSDAFIATNKSVLDPTGKGTIILHLPRQTADHAGLEWYLYPKWKQGDNYEYSI